MKAQVKIIITATILFTLTGCGRLTQVSSGSGSDPGGGLQGQTGTIAGTIVNDSQQAVSGAVVTIVRTDTQVATMRSAAALMTAAASDQALNETVLTTNTDENGYFSISIVPFGTYRISATEGALAGTISDISLGSQTVVDIGEVTVYTAGAVEGIVTLEGETNHSNIMVALLGISPVVYTDANGNYSIGNIPPDTYQLVAVKDGFSTVVTSNVVISSGATTNMQTIQMLIDDENTPPGAPVVTGVSDGETYTGSLVIDVVEVSGETYSATIDDANYTLGTSYSTNGTHALVVVATKTSNGLTNTTDITFTIDIPVDMGSLTGTLIDSGGDRINGASVTLKRDSDDQTITTVQSNSSGVFTFSSVTPDVDYYIEITYDDITGTKTGINLSEGEDKDLGELLFETAGKISGTVNIDGSSDESMVLIYLVEEDISVLSDTSGDYLLQNVPEGSYTLVAQKDGYETVTVNSIQVSVGETTAVDEITMSEGDDPYAEFQVNTTEDGDQKNAKVAELNDGGFVVVYVNEDTQMVLGQLYDSDFNASGSEFTVNSSYLIDSGAPVVAGLSNGGFVVAWSSGDEIFAQLMSSSGSRSGNEFQVNTFTTGEQRGPAVAGLSGGGFVVAWESGDSDNPGPDGSRKSAVARIYNNSGTALTSEFTMNSYSYKHQKDVAVSALSGGGFVAAWVSRDQDFNDYAVIVREFDSNGTATTYEQVVNTNTTGDQGWCDVQSLTGGGYVVAWMSGDSNEPPTYYDGLFAQIYSSGGNTVGSEIEVSSTGFTGVPEDASELDLNPPAIAALSDGGFIVVWDNMDGVDGDGYGVFGQEFTASGAFIGSEIQLNEYTTSDQNKPDAMGLSDGHYVVVWKSAGQDKPSKPNGDGIFGIVK